MVGTDPIWPAPPTNSPRAPPYDESVKSDAPPYIVILIDKLGSIQVHRTKCLRHDIGKWF